VTESPVLEARDASLVYLGGRRRVAAVRAATLQVRAGEFVGLVGPSGSGKSSLLFLLGGLRRPTTGAVRYLGEEWPADADRSAARRRREVGFVFQEPFLIPHLTVRENATVQVLPDTPARRLDELADRLGLSALLEERPAFLSLGERQRAGALRALLNDPALLLADEPTASLDRANAEQVVALLTRNLGRSALVLVTHDPLILARADRVLRVEDGVLRG
jgi:putative ABC transport system ATP-binding protein